MSSAGVRGEAARLAPRPGWCCPYCSAPLELEPHGLRCRAEERWFATQDGIHRLLTEERRSELQPFLEMYRRVRRDEGWRVEPKLPEVGPGHPHAAAWKLRAAHFRRALELIARNLGPGPWHVLDAGAGCCWVAARLIERGHDAVAIDVNLDPDDGLLAASTFVADPRVLPRAEADLDAVPIEAGVFDLVIVSGALHYARRPVRALVELRRVTRRGGLLVVLDTPVYRHREDGEAMVADRMRRHGRRYGVPVSREDESGYLVYGELPDVFRSAGWGLEIHGWPHPLREHLRDIIERGRWGRRTARFPILLGRRDG